MHDLQCRSLRLPAQFQGLTAKAGSTFEISRLLTGEIAVGYTERDYEDPRLPALSGLIANASLIWTASALTTVKLTRHLDGRRIDVPGVSGVLYRDVGVAGRSRVPPLADRQRSRLGFGLDDYVGSPRIDNRYSAGGVTYKLNRDRADQRRMRQDWLRSNVSRATTTRRTSSCSACGCSADALFLAEQAARSRRATPGAMSSRASA